MGYGQGHATLAAIAHTTRAGGLVGHRAVHAHLAHVHTAGGSTGRHGIHGAGERGEGRLQAKERCKSQSNDLKTLVHQLDGIITGVLTL